jgi:hypothetical protein
MLTGISSKREGKQKHADSLVAQRLVVVWHWDVWYYSIYPTHQSVMRIGL